MKLSLIGMSGSGKSFWSERLERQGFVRFCIDELIQQRIAREELHNDLENIHDVASWMGFPYEVRYINNSKQYLIFEKETLEAVLRAVKNLPDTKDIIVDTTGSVAYLPKDTLRELANSTTIVYLETPLSAQQELYRQYRENPKPILWGDNFSRHTEETPEEALRRCYPRLLASRTKAYEALADYILKYETRRGQDFTTDNFVEYLRTLNS